MRTYFHVDMDAFFVSVEELFDPSLIGKPVVVGGGPNDRGVVSAASYAARKFGVHSAMPLRTASKLCPQAIFVPGHPDRYRDCSQKVYAVLQSFTPVVEMASIDEAYLDMTGTERLYGPPLRAAHLLHQRMKAETRLNCSVGIATSRLVAKITSDQAKPNGVLWVVPGQEAAFLAPLDVRKVPGVGKSPRKISTLWESARSAIWRDSTRNFWSSDSANGVWPWQGNPVGWMRAAGSIRKLVSTMDRSRSATNIRLTKIPSNFATIEPTLARLSEMVGRRLREHGLQARTIQLKLRYSDFTTITRAHSVPRATQLDTEIFDEIRALFQQNWKPGAKVRLLGVHVSGWEHGEEQLDLLGEDRHEKWKQAMAAADKMRDRFGESAVSLAASMRGKFRERTHENPVGLPGKKQRLNDKG